MTLQKITLSAEATVPTPSTSSNTTEKSKTDDRQPFRDAVVSFAIDISGSTYGSTLAAEKAFIRSVSNLLSPRARFSSKILPWDDKAHRILSLAQLNDLEDQGGTDPGALLANSSHKAALRESSLWFLMTDGLIPAEVRSKFARDIAQHGVHGVSCVVVVFGNPSTGPASCDISVGVGVFAIVPNCAFLFCNETNGDLRVMQTKGTFNVLLKGQPHPVFESSSRWDVLPQISIADFAAVSVPAPQRLGANEVALQDSLIINMDDLFANRLSPDQIANIFSDVSNLDSVRMTLQARNQQGDFRHWLQQQTIRPDDPLIIPRSDLEGKAESLFTELIDLVSRGQSPPNPLQSRLRAAYRENMRLFIVAAQRQIRMATERKDVIADVSRSSYSPIHLSPAMTPSRSHRPPISGPQREKPSWDEVSSVTPQNQIVHASSRPPGAPRPVRRTGWSKESPTSTETYQRKAVEERWGSWETSEIDPSLRNLLYTTGLRSTKGSFKGTCPLCGASDMTMAWLFRAPFSTLSKPPTPGATEGFPSPGSRIRLAFPLAMGSFMETSGVLASISTAPTPLLSGPVPQTPTLVCDPCSAMYTRNGALSFGVTVALPLVRFSGNQEAVCNALNIAFEGRFANCDLPQVFLSVLLLATEKRAPTPRLPPTPTPSELDFDIPATMAAAAAAGTFRAAVEWTVRDLLHSVVTLRELSESFSLPSDSPAPVWPLVTVLTGSFEELDSSCFSGEQDMVVPLLRYPLPGFLAILKAASVINVAIETRRRSAFRRLLHLVCEELDKAAEQAPHSQSVAQLFGGLLGRPLTPHPTIVEQGSKWELAVSVSIQSLRFTSLLSAASYSMLSRAEEFQYLEDPSATWVGPAIALFLHTLYSVVTASPRMGASETFQAVMSTVPVGNALLRPEELDQDIVSSILSEI